jgi:hypothetical protein
MTSAPTYAPTVLGDDSNASDDDSKTFGGSLVIIGAVVSYSLLPVFEHPNNPPPLLKI